MLAKTRWAVVGDALNPAKPAFAVAERLRARGKTVHLVNPRERNGRCFLSLAEAAAAAAAAADDAASDAAAASGAAAIDVVDLIISPKLGPSIIEEMRSLGIPDVFIQPGAGSDEIRDACREAGIRVHEGCVLREL